MSGSELDGSSPRSDALHTPCGTDGGSSTKRVPAPAVVESQRWMLEEVDDKSSTSSEDPVSPVKLDFDDVELSYGAMEHFIESPPSLGTSVRLC